MERNIEKIELIFEDGEILDIPYEYITDLRLDEGRALADGTKTAKTFRLTVAAEYNLKSQFSKTPAVWRLIDRRDVVRVTVFYRRGDVTEPEIFDDYVIPWTDTPERKNYLSNRFGSLRYLCPDDVPDPENLRQHGFLGLLSDVFLAITEDDALVDTVKERAYLPVAEQARFRKERSRIPPFEPMRETFDNELPESDCAVWLRMEHCLYNVITSVLVPAVYKRDEGFIYRDNEFGMTPVYWQYRKASR